MKALTINMKRREEKYNNAQWKRIDDAPRQELHNAQQQLLMFVLKLIPSKMFYYFYHMQSDA